MQLTHKIVLTALALLFISNTNHAQQGGAETKADISNVAQFVGQEVLFTGVVDSVRQIASGTTFLDFGGRHPNATFTCVAFASKAAEIGDLSGLSGQNIQVRGIVGEFNGKPQIILNSRDQITTVEAAPAQAPRTSTPAPAPAQTGARTSASTEQSPPTRSDTPSRSGSWQAPAYLEGIRPGWPKEFTVDLTAAEISQIPKAELPLLEPKSAKGALVIPPNFDPSKKYNVFIVYSTCDGGGAHVNSGIKMFASTLSDNGWVGIAAQGHRLKGGLSNDWNRIMTLAVINKLSQDIPNLRTWNFYLGGNSGGASRSGSMAPIFKKEGLNVAGVFLAGSGNRNTFLESMNAEKLRTRDFTPAIYISHGKQDNVAVLSHAIQLENSFRKADFTQIKADHFDGGHDLNRESVARALQWFSAGAPAEKRK